MKRWCTCLAVVALFGCGNDGASTNSTSEPDATVIELDTGTPDAGSGSNATTGDASNASTNNGANGETPRDDLEVVVEDREVDFQGGTSGRLAFDVPDDAVSVTVSIEGDVGTFYTLAEWKNGDGEDLVPSGWVDSDPGAPTFCLGCPNRVGGFEGASAAIAPNNRSVGIVSGTHNVSVYGYRQAGFSITPISDATATVQVLVKRLASEPTDGVLDLNFHFTGANGWTAETAQEDAEFQKTIDDVEAIYDQVGLELGVVTYSDVGEEYQVIEGVGAPNGDIQELFALSEGQPRRALNVFIVEELISIFGSQGGVIAGISGGIPGPPMAGTPGSGVAIATKQDPRFPVDFTHVLAHEVGHHLGLYHTTENELAGGLHDPIEDTPEDDPSLLMFTTPEGTTLTPTQGEVMRRSRWVNHGGGQ